MSCSWANLPENNNNKIGGKDMLEEVRKRITETTSADPNVYRTYQTSIVISENPPAKTYWAPVSNETKQHIDKLGTIGKWLINQLLHIQGVAKVEIEPYRVRVYRSAAVDWIDILPYVHGRLKDCFWYPTGAKACYDKVELQLLSDEPTRPEFNQLTMDPQNPVPFAYPLLVIHWEGGKAWHIDVRGKIDQYLANYSVAYTNYKAMSSEQRQEKGIDSTIISEGGNWLSQATPLLKEMLAEFSKYDMKVWSVHTYRGCGGPSHVLLNGAIFKRITLNEVAPGIDASAEKEKRAEGRSDVGPLLHLLAVNPVQE